MKSNTLCNFVRNVVRFIYMSFLLFHLLRDTFIDTDKNSERIQVLEKKTIHLLWSYRPVCNKLWKYLKIHFFNAVNLLHYWFSLYCSFLLSQINSTLLFTTSIRKSTAFIYIYGTHQRTNTKYEMFENMKMAWTLRLPGYVLHFEYLLFL